MIEKSMLSPEGRLLRSTLRSSQNPRRSSQTALFSGPGTVPVASNFVDPKRTQVIKHMPCSSTPLPRFRRSRALLALLALLLLPVLADAQSGRTSPQTGRKFEKHSPRALPQFSPRWQQWTAPKGTDAAAKPTRPAGHRLQPIPDLIANYPFATSTTGSLTDMSSGTTTLIGSNEDDTGSLVTPIGFDFYFQGTRQERFSVSSNGALGFGDNPVPTFPYRPLGQPGVAIVSAYGSDQRTHPGDGKVHYKVIGTAPNRVLVVEWLNMQSSYPDGGAADLTYQVRLTESLGQIEFVYGAMRLSADAVGYFDARNPHIGFSSGDLPGEIGSVIAPQSGSPSFDATSAPAIGNTYDEGPITILTSTANGARRTFTFAPPPPTPPGGPLAFSDITQSTMTLNWTDSPDELLYALSNSTDNVNFTFVTTLPADSTSYVATNLNAGVTYYWRVQAVSEGSFGTLAGSASTTPPLPNVSVVTGNWDDPATWSAGVPDSTQAVTVSSGTTVTVNTGAFAYSLSVTGTLQFESTTAQNLTVTRDVTIPPGGTFRSSASGTQINHNLSLGGSLTNDGTLDFSTNGNTAGASITFTGTSNATFGGTGATTDIRALTVDKGTDRTPLLELIPTNFTVRGVTTNSAAWITLNAGTIRIGGTFTGNNRVFSASGGGYFIPSPAGFWLDNPNYTVAAQNATAVVDGHLRLTQGTLNIGTTATTGVASQFDGAVFTIEGGTLNCSGIFAPGSAVLYHQSGGTVNVATVGNGIQFLGSFDLFNPNSTFDMTGGTIVSHRRPTNANSFGYLNLAAVAAATGTLQIGSASTQAGSTISITGSTPNLVIDNTTNTKVVRIAPNTFDVPDSRLSIHGSTTIQPGSTLNLNGRVCVVYGSSFTNHGTLNGTAANSWLVFDSATAQATYQGSGLVTAPLAKLEIYNSFGLTIDPAVNQITTLELALSAGQLTGANKITIGHGGTTTSLFTIGAAGGGRPVLGVDVTPVYNPGSGGITLIYEQEATPRTTGAEVPTSRIIDQLIFRHDTIIGGGDLTVAYLLDLTATRVSTGPNTLSLAAGASVIRNDTGFGYVEGNLRRVIPGAGSGTVRFDVGAQVDASSGYGPLDFVVNSGTFPATVTVSTAPGRPAYADPFLNALQRSWKITTDQPLNANLTFNYQAFEILTSYASYLFLKLQNGVYSSYTPSFTPMETSAVLNGASLTGVSEWTMVEPTAPTFLNLDSTVFVVGQSNTFTFSVIAAPDPSLSVDPMSDPLPDGVTFHPATGVLSGTPAAGTNGTYLLIVTAANGTFDMQQYFYLYVSDTANQNPVANADIMGTRQGVAATVPAIRLMINDTDPDGDTLSISGVSSTSTQGGTITHCGCFQHVTYYPPPGFSGTDSFTYTLSDGRGGTATGTVTVTVSPGSAGSQNITGLTMPGGVPTLTAFGIPGRVYRLEYTDDMGGAWSPLASVAAGPNGALVLTDPSSPLPPSRFYRVVEDF